MSLSTQPISSELAVTINAAKDEMQPGHHQSSEGHQDNFHFIGDVKPSPLQHTSSTLSSLSNIDSSSVGGHSHSSNDVDPEAGTTTAPHPRENIALLLVADLCMRLLNGGMKGRNAIPIRIKLLFEQIFAELSAQPWLAEFLLRRLHWTKEEFARGYKASALGGGFNCVDSITEIRLLAEAYTRLMGSLPHSACLAANLLFRRIIDPSVQAVINSVARQQQKPELSAAQTPEAEGPVECPGTQLSPSLHSPTPVRPSPIMFGEIPPNESEEQGNDAFDCSTSTPNTALLCMTTAAANVANGELLNRGASTPSTLTIGNENCSDSSPSDVSNTLPALAGCHPSPGMVPQLPIIPMLQSPVAIVAQLPEIAAPNIIPSTTCGGRTAGKRHQMFAQSSVGKNGKQRVQCPKCGWYYCDRGALKIHDYAIHKQEKHCCTVPGCTKSFSSRRSRNRHASNTTIHKGIVDTREQLTQEYQSANADSHAGDDNEPISVDEVDVPEPMNLSIGDRYANRSNSL